MTPHEHEAGFVNSFMVRERRARALELLSSPAKRIKLLDRLDHRPDLDVRYCEAIPPASDSPADIDRLLRGYGAPDKAYVLSSSRTLDGKVLGLRGALDEIVGHGMGSVISCIPGQLAYYEGESAGDRCILRRDAR
jgi:hypothetical protein